MIRRRRVLVRALPLVALAAALAGCGSSGPGSPAVPTVAPARTFQIAGFTPSEPVSPHTPVTVSFHIELPSGKTLTDFRRGAGPHTGVHLILVRNDLSAIIHEHPRIEANGTVRQTLEFPEPGKYHVLVDVYPIIPATPQLVNFQLTDERDRPREGHDHAAAAVQPRGDGRRLPREDPEDAAHLGADSRLRDDPDPQRAGRGRPELEPWFGALAHAIFFRVGSLAYFHTHICAPSAPGCASLVGGKALTGSGSSDGLLHVGILLPQSGTLAAVPAVPGRSPRPDRAVHVAGTLTACG